MQDQGVIISMQVANSKKIQDLVTQISLKKTSTTVSIVLHAETIGSQAFVSLKTWHNSQYLIGQNKLKAWIVSAMGEEQISYRSKRSRQ